MTPFTQVAHQLVAEHLKAGDSAIDATAGNGHDALFLTETVGPDGRVFVLDIQPCALAATAARIPPLLQQSVIYCHACHSRMAEVIPVEFHGQVTAIMFNLGYLPGGDKTVTTQPETTQAAVRQASRLLRTGGILTLLAYPGHETGGREVSTLLNLFDDLKTELTFREIDAGDNPVNPGQSQERSPRPRLFVGLRTA